MRKVTCDVRIDVPGSFDDATQAGFQFAQVSGLKLSGIKAKRGDDGHFLYGKVSFDVAEEADEVAKTEAT